MFGFKVAWKELKLTLAEWRAKQSSRPPKTPAPPDTESDSSGEPPKPKTSIFKNKELYFGVIFANYAVLALLTLILLAFGQPWYLILIIAALQTIASIDKSGYQEYVAVIFFDIVVLQPETGPFFRLFPFMGKLPVPLPAQQVQFPDEPENVFHGDDKEPLPPGMVRVYRVMSGPPRTDGTFTGPTNIRMTTKATGTVRYEIEDVMAFLKAMAGATPEEKIEEARRQLYDTWSNSVVREYTLRPVGLVSDEISLICQKVRADLEKMTASWGIRILEVTLRSPDLGHALSSKLSEIGETLAEQVSANTRTDTAAYATRQAGAAEGDAEYDRRRGRADGIKYEADLLGIEGATVFGANAAKDIFGGKEKFVFGINGAIDAMKSGAAVAAAYLEDQKKEKPKDA